MRGSRYDINKSYNARKEIYRLYSDLDITIWGLDEKHCYWTVVKLLDLDPEERVDLVKKEDAGDLLPDVIHQEGVLLRKLDILNFSSHS